MKRLFFLLSLFCLLPPAVIAQVRQLSCKVVGISDGDTLTCLHNRKPIKVRLLYIDAPESVQPFGNRAKQALSALAFKKQVRLESSGYDRYQRLLAVVYDEQNRNLNLQLVKQGMAWAYRQTQPMYQQAQQHAQASKLGLWQDKQPINPADWRANHTHKGVRNEQILQNLPSKNASLNCRTQLSCKEMERRGFSYLQVKQHFLQCGWKERDGNEDGIPCNRLYRKWQQNPSNQRDKAG